jgi:tryptophan aminotransferase
MQTATSNLQTSSFTQAVVFKLLEHWGLEGFKAHCERVSAFYTAKRDVFEQAMKKHLDGLVEWTRPDSGLFFWSVSNLIVIVTPTPFLFVNGRFKLLLPGDGDSESIIKSKAYEKGVLALPGSVFIPSGKKTAYVRCAFSLLSEEEIDEALRRLKEVVLSESAA